MAEWQTIETAPKDGTNVLICMPGMRTPWVARWQYIGPRAGYRWQSFCSVPFQPTHWMPLPEPPAEPEV